MISCLTKDRAFGCRATCAVLFVLLFATAANGQVPPDREPEQSYRRSRRAYSTRRATPHQAPESQRRRTRSRVEHAQYAPSPHGHSHTEFSGPPSGADLGPATPWQRPQSRPVRGNRFAYYQAPGRMNLPAPRSSGPYEEVQPDIQYDTPTDGDVVWEGDPGPWPAGPVDEFGAYPGDYHGGCDDCGGCNECYGGYGGAWGCGLFCGHPWFENFSVNLGSHAFIAANDFGRASNFGFQEGINFGAPLPFYLPWNLGWQFGVQTLQSAFEGNNALGTFSPETHNQVFITTGIFHRPLHSPFQWGVVFDWVDDDYYVDMTMSQVRAELSLLGPLGNEVGFWGAFATGDGEDTLVQDDFTNLVKWEPNDIYTFFYRRRFPCTPAELRIWGGFTGNSDGIFGGDFRIPVTDWLALNGGGNYLASEEEKEAGGLSEDSWGMFFNVVLYPAKTAIKSTRSPYRPLFNVAEPSVMMTEVIQD